MDYQCAERLIATFSGYSAEAVRVLEYLQKYDYSGEAAKWETMRQPTVIEAEHPTLNDLYLRLVRYISNIPHRSDNLDRDVLLTQDNFQTFCNYLQVSEETLLAACFNRISIEPMQSVADAFQALNLTKEAGLLHRVYDYAYCIRQWYQKSKRNPGTPIELKLEINYDEATLEDLAADKGCATFLRLFKPSCNYSAKQKRALYNGLKALYASEDPKTADKIVMAVILLFRKPKTHYRQPFGTKNISTCKETAMESFGRDCQAIRSYSENSLTSAPKLADAHVKRAESIIAAALDSI